MEIDITLTSRNKEELVRIANMLLEHGNFSWASEFDGTFDEYVLSAELSGAAWFKILWELTEEYLRQGQVFL